MEKLGYSAVVELPISRDAGEMVDADTGEAFQLARNACVPLGIKQQVDSEVSDMEGIPRYVFHGLNDGAEWTTRAEHRACEPFGAAGDLLNDGFATRTIQLDPLSPRIAFVYTSGIRAMDTDRDRYLLDIMQIGARFSVGIEIRVDFIARGLEQIRGNTTQTGNVIVASLLAPVEEQKG